MSEIDVLEQLERYGTWLGGRLGASVTPGSTQPEDGSSGSEEPLVDATFGAERPSTPSGAWRRRSLLLGAAAATIAVLVTVEVVSSDRPSVDVSLGAMLTDVVSATEPGGGAFVVPGDAGVAITNAWSDDQGEAPLGAGDRYALVGRTEGAVTSGLIAVAVSAQPMAVPPDAETIETALGPAIVVRIADMVSIVQARGELTVSVSTRAVRQQAAVELLEHIDLSGPSIRIDEPDSVVVVAGAKVSGSGWRSAGYEIGVGTAPVSVDVADSDESFLVVAARIADTLTPVEVRGVAGVRLSRADPEGAWNALLWRETPTRFVALSGHVTIETLEEIAAGLTLVDETSWRARFEEVGTFPS